MFYGNSLVRAHTVFGICLSRKWDGWAAPYRDAWFSESMDHANLHGWSTVQGLPCGRRLSCWGLGMPEPPGAHLSARFRPVTDAILVFSFEVKTEALR